jgi:hypothetical protein
MSSKDNVLGLRAGDYVQVRSLEEILSTLDNKGRFEAMPFMPEMLQFCGRKFRVQARADKTCDNIQGWSIRRLNDSVHLEGLRCDGGGHGGCEAGCLIFWKEAWLKRSAEPTSLSESAPLTNNQPEQHQCCTQQDIVCATKSTNEKGEIVYSCQATDLLKFTSYMRRSDPRQYIRDLRSGNLRVALGDGTRWHRSLEFILEILRIIQSLVITYFNIAQSWRHGRAYPFIEGKLEKTSAEHLNLQPGELVQVRSKDEIIATLDKNQRNRGLFFDSEMMPYCGGIYRVLRRVHHIVDEKTGKMIDMKNPCIVLEGVVCKSDFHRLCPRAIYSYWRENWLMRVSSLNDPEPSKVGTVQISQDRLQSPRSEDHCSH